MTSADIDRVAWALLARAASGPCAPILDLVRRVGVSEAAAAVHSGDVPVALAPAVLERGSSFDAAERDLDRIERLGGRLVTPDDEEWPHELLDCLPTGSENPGDVAPLALWVRGPWALREATARAIAVVGARASTAYGNHVASSLAGDLACAGWSVVSGAAHGIDGMAHRGALAVDGMTIAVMPCGLDRPYPNAHEGLLAEIGDRGLIVSEYPPGTTVHRHSLLDRNRLIAALSASVVAVEAGLRSGTASTLRWARRYGRTAFAVPGPVTSEASRGCHRFIADGGARLVTSAADVLAVLTEPTEPDTAVVGPYLAADGVIR